MFYEQNTSCKDYPEVGKYTNIPDWSKTQKGFMFEKDKINVFNSIVKAKKFIPGPGHYEKQIPNIVGAGISSQRDRIGPMDDAQFQGK